MDSHKAVGDILVNAAFPDVPPAAHPKIRMVPQK